MLSNELIKSMATCLLAWMHYNINYEDKFIGLFFSELWHASEWTRTGRGFIVIVQQPLNL